MNGEINCGTSDTEILFIIKRNELSSHGKKLKCVLLSEKRLSEKATYYLTNKIVSWKRPKQMIETMRRSVVARGGNRTLRAMKLLCVSPGHDGGYMSLNICEDP